jgi:1,4-alpha-glucan branching enzyme
MSPAHLCLVLHAHLPFVRHPEHERFLEESWLFEAVIESYLPLLQVLEGWHRDRIPARITFTLTPTLCSMLRDPLLQLRCGRHLDRLIDLADQEIHRTTFQKPFQRVAIFYYERLLSLRRTWRECGENLVARFRVMQERGQVEIMTCAATHALLPLFAPHPPSVRAQLLTARDHYQECFGIAPSGIWLPECAWSAALEAPLLEAGLEWFVTDTHGLRHAEPRPRFEQFAPILSPGGLVVFGRDQESARQVWSRDEGYPGDFRYRDFYRDIGFDLDLSYLEPYLSSPGIRGFTGLKYYQITGPNSDKEPYDRQAALTAADDHARHFLEARLHQVQETASIMGQPPLLLCPYDAELFGHWWYEGPEFLDRLGRRARELIQELNFCTPGDYLKARFPLQVGMPADSSWGEEGYWKVWLNEKNHWMYPPTREAGVTMTALVRRFGKGSTYAVRALKQAARELLLAQSSDWPFILRMGTSADYARRRVTVHLDNFYQLQCGLESGTLDEANLARLEAQNNLFPGVQPDYWAEPT